MRTPRTHEHPEAPVDSTLFTIGTALNRARDHDMVVRLLVCGQWVEGSVSAVDGHGVVLTGSTTGYQVVRVEDISVVQVFDNDTQDQAPPREWAPEPSPREAPASSRDREAAGPEGFTAAEQGLIRLRSAH